MIQKQLVDRLALALLEGEIREGQRVEVDAKKGELSFDTAGTAEPKTDPAEAATA